MKATQQPQGPKAPKSVKLPVDVEALLPLVAEAQDTTQHAVMVKAVSDTVRSAARVLKLKAA